MIELTYFITLIALLILAGACLSKLSSYLNVPVLLIFLGVGMLLGSDGLNIIPFDDAVQANAIGTIAMAFILFAGGYDSRWKSVKSVLVPGSILSSFGVLLTAFFVGLFVHYFLNVPLEWGFLLGSIVSSTDAAAVFAILRSRSVSLKGNVQSLLEYESGSNDPMAALLTIFMISMLKNPGLSYWMIIPTFFLKMGIGILVGWFVGRTTIWLINRINLEYDGLYYVIGIGIVLLAYGGSESIEGNGFMAVYVCGMVLGNHSFLYCKSLKRFHDGIGWLMQVLLFCTLGLLVFPKQLLGIAVAGLAVAGFLMFFARPLSVFIGLVGSKFSWRERAFISWVGLRGGAPIMLATFPMLHGTPNYDQMFNIVFFIVLTSVLVQGKTLMPLARLLKLDKPLKPQRRLPLEFEHTGNSDDDMLELELPEHSPFAGKTIAELGLPPGALILLILRQSQLVVPQGQTVLEPGDVLLVLGSAEITAATRQLLLPDGTGEDE